MAQFVFTLLVMFFLESQPLMGGSMLLKITLW